MRRILTSLLVVGVVAASAVYATNAFFSDTETSEGNVLAAGEIDLTVTNEGSATDPFCEFTDTPGGPLFNCTDVKPGDSGETTLHFELTSNPAWACVFVNNYVDSDETCVEPENEAEGVGVCGTDADGGELDDALVLTNVWVDDGAGGGIACDNVLNGTEEVVASNAPLSSFGLSGSSLVLPVSDTSGSSMMNAALQPGEHCLGVAWSVDTAAGNEVQTDSLSGDLAFYVEQERNNPNFTCAGVVPPDAGN